MSKGFIMVSREILNDPMYFSERFTRMQAFTDLCYLASFKEREFRIRGNKVSLKIGQVAKSVRDLSQRWQWSVNTVLKYLKELQEDGYIDTQRTSVNQIITIKKYLILNTQNDTQNDTQSDTQSDTQNDTPIINNIEELKKENERLKEELANASKKKETSKKKEISSDLETEFDNFRKKYKQYGGQARGLQTELDNLKKKHKDWKEIIPLLSPAVDKENSARKNAEIRGAFFPSMKNLQTYINQRSWEAYADEQQVGDDNEYHPTTDGIFQFWNEERCCLMFNGYIDQLNDGYTKDNRPDGAKVAWSMYEWIWSSRKKEWIKQNE